MFDDNFECFDWTLISLRSLALALTLSGLTGGEFLPLPRSEGGAFPLLLALDGYPNASANIPQGHERPQNSGDFTRVLPFEPPLSIDSSRKTR